MNKINQMNQQSERNLPIQKGAKQENDCVVDSKSIKLEHKEFVV